MLTESEIFSKLQQCLKEAEGACRQLAHWRGDIGWLQLGARFAELQKITLRLASHRSGLQSLYIDPSRRN